MSIQDTAEIVLISVGAILWGVLLIRVVGGYLGMWTYSWCDRRSKIRARKRRAKDIESWGR